MGTKVRTRRHCVDAAGELLSRGLISWGDASAYGETVSNTWDPLRCGLESHTQSDYSLRKKHYTIQWKELITCRNKLLTTVISFQTLLFSALLMLALYITRKYIIRIIPVVDYETGMKPKVQNSIHVASRNVPLFNTYANVQDTTIKNNS